MNVCKYNLSFQTTTKSHLHRYPLPSQHTSTSPATDQCHDRYPKVALGSVVPQNHQVGVGQLPAVGHAQQHAVLYVGHRQLKVDLLRGVADVPGQLEVTAGVQWHVEGHGQSRGRGGPGAGRGVQGVDGSGRGLVRRHQDENQRSQGCEVHDGDVLQAKGPGEYTHSLSNGVAFP